MIVPLSNQSVNASSLGRGGSSLVFALVIVGLEGPAATAGD